MTGEWVGVSAAGGRGGRVDINRQWWATGPDGVPRAPLSPAALDLVARAEDSLRASAAAPVLADRYREAHLAALRAAAAVLAARAMPGRARRLRSVWELLPAVAPELAEWALFYAESGRRRTAIDRGEIPSARECDDLLRQSAVFVDTIVGILGLVDGPRRVAAEDYASRILPSAGRRRATERH